MEIQTAREALALKEGWNGSFGKWLKRYLTETADRCRRDGSRMVPQTLGEEYDRNNLLAKSNALEELCDQIPNTITDRLKELEEKENT